MSFARYNVKVTFKYPAWDEKDGLTVQVFARSKSEANRRVRSQMDDAGHRDFTLRASEAKEDEGPQD